MFNWNSATTAVFIIITISMVLLISLFISFTVSSATTTPKNVIRLEQMEDGRGLPSNKLCYSKTGDWIENRCQCKHPDFISNNFHDGNCDSIVDRYCSQIIHSDTGEVVDFEMHDPYEIGICNCGRFRIYNSDMHKCVLRKLSDTDRYSAALLRGRQQVCDDGYTFSEQYKTCIKKLCSWDILNPTVRIEEEEEETSWKWPGSDSETVCNCNVPQGILQITVLVSDDKTVTGCTKSLLLPPLKKRYVHYVIMRSPSTDFPDAPYVLHLYPASMIDKYLQHNFFPFTKYLKHHKDDVFELRMISIGGGIMEDFFNNIYKDENIKLYTVYNNRRMSKITVADYMQTLHNIIPSHTRLGQQESLTPTTNEELEREEIPTLDEYNGDVRYTFNRLYYSPLTINAENKLTVNKLGMPNYNAIYAFYYSTAQTVLVRPGRR